jgi:uncharacterized protein
MVLDRTRSDPRITVRNGKVTKIREYTDTQALARASKSDASGLA